MSPSAISFDENQPLEVLTCGFLITCDLKLFAPRLGTDRRPINADHFETWFFRAPRIPHWEGQLSLPGDARVVDGVMAIFQQSPTGRLPPLDFTSELNRPPVHLFKKLESAFDTGYAHLIPVCRNKIPAQGQSGKG